MPLLVGKSSSLDCAGIVPLLVGKSKSLACAGIVPLLVDKANSLSCVVIVQGYGIATPPGSPYRTMLSQAILRLQENGDLHVLKVRLMLPVGVFPSAPTNTFPKQAIESLES